MSNSTMPPMTADKIRMLNASDPWKHSIRIEGETSTGEYRLYATGYADVSGRKYVALPTNIDPKNASVRQKYNLL